MKLKKSVTHKMAEFRDKKEGVNEEDMRGGRE